MPNEIPTNEVITMQRQGRSSEQITRELQGKGHSLQNIYEAINQASIKTGVEGTPAPQEDMQESILVPSPSPMVAEAPMPEPPVPAPQATPMPSYPQMPPMTRSPLMPQEPSINYEDIQSLVEEVIDERWKELVSNIGDITSWKMQMNNDIESVKQELLRVEQRFETMQSAIFGKVKEYGSSMEDLGSEMKALEKVFEKIIEPMTANIKDLDRITAQLKGRTKQ